MTWFQFDSASADHLASHRWRKLCATASASAFAGGVIDGGIGIEGAAKPVDPQEHHEEDGQHQGRFGDF